MVKTTDAINTFFCEDCGKKLLWDADGAITGMEFPCWYCPRCGWVDVNGKYPPYVNP